MVLMESLVSGHRYNAIRERLGDKLEIIRFDPKSKYAFKVSSPRIAVSKLISTN